MKTIPLTRGHSVIVDDEDFERLSTHRWHAYPNKSGVYACRTVHGETDHKVRMHREILGLSPSREVVVDHINGNTLDNRRCNLRACSMAENIMNRHRHNHPRSTTGIPGVTPHRDQWRARISVAGRSLNLGLHATLLDAIKARRLAELKHYGAYAPEHALAGAAIAAAMAPSPHRAGG